MNEGTESRTRFISRMCRPKRAAEPTAERSARFSKLSTADKGLPAVAVARRVADRIVLPMVSNKKISGNEWMIRDTSIAHTEIVGPPDTRQQASPDENRQAWRFSNPARAAN